MKVKIGNYPGRLICRIHTRYMDKKYNCVDWPEEQTLFEQFLEKLEDTVQTVYNLINVTFLDKREQKIDVKLDKWDTWSMDTTLAHIVLPMLKQLKATKHGAPQVDVEDVPEELRPTKKELKAYNKDGTTDDKFFERWDWVMDEMIFAFESKLTDWEDQFHSGTMDIYWEKLDNGYSEMKRGPNDTHVWDKEGHVAYQERISNGFRLFGKYYESLWD